MGYMIKMVFPGILVLQAIIQSILESGRLGPNIKFTGCYGLRLKHLKSDEVHWLHPNLTVHEVEKKYEQQHVEAEWRCVFQIPLQVLLHYKRFFNLLCPLKWTDMTWESGTSPLTSWRSWKKIKPPCCIFTTRLMWNVTKPYMWSVKQIFAPIQKFSFLILKVRSDYMQHCASKVSDGMALQLGCLEIRYQHSAKQSAFLLIILTTVILHNFLHFQGQWY